MLLRCSNFNEVMSLGHFNDYSNLFKDEMKAREVEKVNLNQDMEMIISRIIYKFFPES